MTKIIIFFVLEPNDFYDKFCHECSKKSVKIFFHNWKTAVRWLTLVVSECIKPT